MHFKWLHLFLVPMNEWLVNRSSCLRNCVIWAIWETSNTCFKFILLLLIWKPSKINEERNLKCNVCSYATAIIIAKICREKNYLSLNTLSISFTGLCTICCGYTKRYNWVRLRNTFVFIIKSRLIHYSCDYKHFLNHNFFFCRFC